MYFLTEDDRKKLLYHWLPKSRAIDVVEDLRGWNWHRPPLEPPFEGMALEWGLRMGEVAGKFCSTGRDVYIRRILNVEPEVPAQAALGGFFHDVVHEVVYRAKRGVYLHGTDWGRIIGEMTATESEWEMWLRRLPSAVRQKAATAGRRLWDFEAERAFVRLKETVSCHPHLSADALVARALPVVAGQRIDGSYLGLSRHLKVDVGTWAEPMVVNLKFGWRREEDKLTGAGYALAIEAAMEVPVNLGCLIYVTMDEHRIGIEREFYLIDDALRQMFVEERDGRMYNLMYERDPGLPEECPVSCGFLRVCRGVAAGADPGRNPDARVSESDDLSAGMASDQRGVLDGETAEQIGVVRKGARRGEDPEGADRAAKGQTTGGA